MTKKKDACMKKELKDRGHSHRQVISFQFSSSKEPLTIDHFFRN